ncbi:MAG: hypothetical protein ACREP1_04925, partial [Rhodanobacteraceae bacterium]
MPSTLEGAAPQPVETLVAIGDLALAGGGRIANVEQRVTCYGNLNAARDNAVLIPHALTGDSCVARWWPGIV